MMRRFSACSIALMFVLAPALANSAFSPDRPNIVILVADDLGWKDVGYHGSDVKTLNLDQFVRDGIELDRFYVAPYCVPTRAGLLTGRYPHRFGIPYLPNLGLRTALPRDAITLAEMLANAGYVHRACIGKWHLGSDEEQQPLSQGFHSFYGMLGGMVHYYDHRTIPFGPGAQARPRVLDWYRDREPCHDKGYTTDLIGREAVGFIERHVSDQPFFLYVAFNAPHLPLQAKPEQLEPAEVKPPEDTSLFAGDALANRRTFRAMVASLDENIGQILAAIDRLGLRDTTLIWFLSDNGGVDRIGISDNSPLRGGKGTLWEGGVRVPSAIRWPAAWQGGRKVEAPMAYVDVFPTLARIVGQSGPIEGVDGRDVSNVLAGERSGTEEANFERTIYLGPNAVVSKRWKLVEDVVFDLAADPGETADVTGEQADVLSWLQGQVVESR